MKRIIVVIALAATVMTAYAQKTQEAVTKAIEKAEAASKDPKKADKVTTWLNLAKVHMEAYNAPQLNGRIGASTQELAIVMSDIKPTSTQTETVGNTQYTVQVYPTCKYYINPNGALEMIVTTQWYEERPLMKALYAYVQAAKVDPKGTKTKEISDGIQMVCDNLRQEAIIAYNFSDFKLASERFAEAADAASQSPAGVIDTMSIYNAGWTAFMAKNWEKARDQFVKAIALGYLQDGDAYYKLSESYKNLGDTLAYKATLEKGFIACPTSQPVLIGLINYYIESKENPDKLFEILKLAEQNEPNNVALYYVEGNTRRQLGQLDEALAAYDKCTEINPEYEFGEIGKGVLYTGEGDKYGQLANAEDNIKKYEELLVKCEKNYKLGIEHFEKAIQISKNDATKSLIVQQYLKPLYFKFRNESEEYQKGYEKYSNWGSQQ